MINSSRTRLMGYCLYGALLLLLLVPLQHLHWPSSAAVHTVLEVIATCFALVVGSLALVRYYSRPEPKFLYIGAGFIGSGVLDAFHALVSSVWFISSFPTEPSSVIAWSWIFSRLFLAIMLILSIYHPMEKNGEHAASASKHHRRWVYGGSILAIAACYAVLVLAPLPPPYLNNGWLPRPIEWLAGLLFLTALAAHLHAGNWREHYFDHWLVYALLTGSVAQLFFMAFSEQVFDGYFDIAHLLKITSYAMVMLGLFISIFRTYRQLEQESRQHQLADARNRMLAMAVDKCPVAVVITDQQANIEYCNPKALNMLGYAKTEVIGRNPSMFASGKTPETTYREMWEKLHRGEDWSGIFINRKASGEEIIEEAHISPLITELQQPSHFIAIKYDITQRFQQDQINWRKANYDQLTQLPNRSLFIDRVQNAIKAEKRSAAKIAILFIDLDGFKFINDRHGHAIGDRVLQGVAGRMQQTLRESDTLARFGGDEFVLLLNNYKNLEEVNLIGERMLSAIRQPCVIDQLNLSISASIGVARYPDHADNVDELIARADAAMYQIKKKSGAGIMHYTAGV